jgi:hypothetical protein
MPRPLPTKLLLAVLATATTASSFASENETTTRGLIGYWKLQGDCRDHSGGGHDGVNHNVNLATSQFSGQGSYIEVPHDSSWNLGRGDFSFAVWIHTEPELSDVLGDIVTKFDPAARKGFNFTINASAPGYNSSSNTRHLFFGLDNNTNGKWADCGRPNPKTHISDALTVLNGDLYVGTTDGPQLSDWAHVYRYKGKQNGDAEWEDCGRVGTGKTRGVYAMVVHDGALYAATSASHGTQPAGTIDFGRVYVYRGGQKWEDLGQPGENERLHSLASFRGKLYVAGFNIGPAPGHVYVYGGNEWKECGEFDGWPCPLAVHDGRLYTANPQAAVFEYDGDKWTHLKNPHGEWAECQQIHSIGVHRGELHVGSWPRGKIAVRRGGKWVDLGRLGDATEVVGIVTYNGSLYGGTIPRAEVFRWDERGNWNSVRRLFDPPGFVPAPIGSGAKAVEDWSRASSFAVYNGKLFSTTATCYRTMLDSPPADDVRGKVFSYATGATVGDDRDLGPGWKHVAAVREGNELKLYVDSRLVSSAKTDGATFDVSTDVPLRIGFGPHSHFCGKIREVRWYNRALSDADLQSLGRRNPATLSCKD